MNKKPLTIVIIFLLIIAALAMYFFRSEIVRRFYTPTKNLVEQGIGTGIKDGGKAEQSENENKDIEVIADNLQIPWEIVFLPDGEMLVSERQGTIQKIGKENQTYKIEGVEHIGEGGLLGMALHPRFEENYFIYFYLTTRTRDGLRNRVERYRFEKNSFSEKTIIIDNIPADKNHNGGRISFGFDGNLYITTGDSGQSSLAQDTNSLAGKILRVKDDGSIPSDNPFGNAVYSYGHRNPQGIAWDGEGRLWATEHGRSGVLSGFDELNLIEKGKNYGWPIIQGDETKENMESPVAHSGSSTTWAPAGAAFWNGSVFFGGLRGESLYEARLVDDGKVSVKAHFRQEFGRIRAVVLGPDNYLYITTSNTDGRGTPRANNDKVIRINPNVFSVE